MTRPFQPSEGAPNQAYGAVVRPAGLSDDKWARLEGFLESLPLSAAEKLFAALVSDQRAGGSAGKAAQGLPHDALLAVLRPIIVERGGRFPARRKTAQRMFVQPFEDFLVTTRRGRKREARIPRTSLQPIWDLMMSDPATHSASRMAGQLDKALERGDADEAIDDLRRSFFYAASDGLSTILGHASENDAYRTDLAARLGGGSQGAAMSHDLAEICHIIPLADHFLKLQNLFPRPVASFTEEELFEARRCYAAAHETDPEQAGYVLLALAGRMETPWRAMRLYYHLSTANDDTLGRVREDASLISNVLFDDLESMARLLERDAEHDFDADDAALRLEYFTDFASGMIDEARTAGDAVTVNRVEASRDVAASALQRFCEQALMAIRRAEPTRHAGGSSHLKALRPDINRPLDRASVDAARAAAEFLSSAGSLSARLDRANSSGPLIDETAAQTLRYAQDLILEIRAAEGEERRRARRYMEIALDLARPFHPPAEIALLKEKAAVAAVSA